MDGMGDMGGMAMPPPSPMGPNSNSTMPGGSGSMKKNMVMMHMTFFWGKNTEILFDGWPGTRTGMYALSVIVVFFLAVLVEWISRCRFVKSDSGVRGLVLTLLHAVRMGLAYLVMLAIMSFNGGIFIAAVAGHAVGFFVFGTRVFRKGGDDDRSRNYREKTVELPPLSC